MKILATLISSLFAAGVFAAPVPNIDPASHPDLSAAQNLIAQASAKIATAQKRNLYGGNAAAAQKLLDQANLELANAANSMIKK